MKLLNKIQQTLKVPKNQLNKFGGFNYRSAEDILESVKPLLDKGTLVCSDSMVQIGDRVYVETTATLTESENTVSAKGYAREPLAKKGMDESQITGSTASYARKRALGNLFSIDDEKDPDTMDNNKPAIKPAEKQTVKPTKAPPPTATEKKVLQLIGDKYNENADSGMVVDMKKLKQAVWDKYRKYPTKDASVGKVLEEIPIEDVIISNDFIEGIN
jgi:hypothetical protein